MFCFYVNVARAFNKQKSPCVTRNDDLEHMEIRFVISSISENVVSDSTRASYGT